MKATLKAIPGRQFLSSAGLHAAQVRMAQECWAEGLGVLRAAERVYDRTGALLGLDYIGEVYDRMDDSFGLWQVLDDTLGRIEMREAA